MTEFGTQTDGGLLEGEEAWLELSRCLGLCALLGLFNEGGFLMKL
jgi:hypothetical protein